MKLYVSGVGYINQSYLDLAMAKIIETYNPETIMYNDWEGVPAAINAWSRANNRTRDERIRSNEFIGNDRERREARDMHAITSCDKAVLFWDGRAKWTARMADCLWLADKLVLAIDMFVADDYATYEKPALPLFSDTTDGPIIPVKLHDFIEGATPATTSAGPTDSTLLRIEELYTRYRELAGSTGSPPRQERPRGGLRGLSGTLAVPSEEVETESPVVYYGANR